MGCSGTLEHSFVVIMRANPNPDEIRTIFNCKSPVINPNPDRPEITCLFETERGVSVVCSEEFKITVSQYVNMPGKFFVTQPKPLGCSVHLESPQISFILLVTRFSDKKIELP